MSLFAFEAIDAQGRRKRGEIEADSERLARQQLKQAQWVVRSLSAVPEQVAETGMRPGRRLAATETVLLLQQLSTLTEAGMQLADALASIAEGMESRRGRQVVGALRQSVLQGNSLASSLRQQRFDELVCNMVAAGEESGQLAAVLERLLELLEHRQRFRQDILSATLYPSIILAFGIIVMLFLLAVVVPQVVTVFRQTGAELPWLTQVVIALSGFLHAYGAWLIVGVIMLVLAYRQGLKRARLRQTRDTLLLSLPGLSSLLLRIETARFARMLGMLLSGGVAVLPAMDIANQSWALLPLKQVGEAAREELREGGSLAEALRRAAIPSMAIRLIAVGEQSGELDTMLLRVASHYEQEVSRRLKWLLTIAEPLLVLLMAVCVGALAMAVLLPIVEMNSLIR